MVLQSILPYMALGRAYAAPLAQGKACIYAVISYHEAKTRMMSSNVDLCFCLCLVVELQIQCCCLFSVPCSLVQAALDLPAAAPLQALAATPQYGLPYPLAADPVILTAEQALLLEGWVREGQQGQHHRGYEGELKGWRHLGRQCLVSSPVWQIVYIIPWWRSLWIFLHLQLDGSISSGRQEGPMRAAIKLWG